MSAFLSPADLFSLTGYKRSADQIRWLKRNGIAHYVNKLGRPVVWKDQQSASRPVARKELGHVQ
jgi:hypothetical protein